MRIFAPCRSTRRLAGLLALAGVAAGAVTLLSSAPSGRAESRPDARKNIVFVLADDLSWNLVARMPHVQALRRRGATFSEYYVTDSLCCPSRASIFTGQLPHNTHVVGNQPPRGGAVAFERNGGPERVYAKTLQAAGYRTAMMGKYLNGHGAGSPEPPYWNEWLVAGKTGYREYGYRLNHNGTLTARHGFRPRDYLVRTLTRHARRFIARSAAERAPFALEVAPYATHSALGGQRHDHPWIRPGFAVPDARDAKSCRGVHVPRGPAYDVRNVHPPSWLAHRPPLTAAQKRKLDRQFCKRVQAAKAIDRMIGAIERQLVRAGVAGNTYLVFSSDNGFHTGQHRLLAGKMTAFETDIRVPLVIAGPGVRPGMTIDRLTENIDLAPTFDRIARTRPPATVDGHSLLGLLHGDRGVRWRKRLLIEHRHATKRSAGPDRQARAAGDPTSYKALRGPGFLYVRYLPRPHEHEYYALRGRPYADERVNRYGGLSQPRRVSLDRQLERLRTCAGPASCWAAAGGR